MKRLTALLMVSVLAVCCLASCGSEKDKVYGDKTATEAVAEATTEASAEATTEATKADDKDSDGKSGNVYTYEGASITLPDGFTVKNVSAARVAYPPDYPTKTDNIAFTSSPADKASNYTKQILDSTYQNMFKGFSSVGFENITLDGHDAIKYSYKMEMSGVKMIQTQILLFLDAKTVIFTFVSVSGDYDKAFEQSIESIKAV